ncbi:MAG: ABC transporter permease [Bifidobacteriaceae bacterium]|jgi:erythritol transport system permease protein|nr:ABC transporter permease [Bifidobacteriaceae bacterium]
MSLTINDKAAAATAAEPAGGRARRRPNLGELLIEGRSLIALVLIIVLFTALAPDQYLTVDSLIVMTRHVAINAIIALGMLLVILTGGIDLSVGSTVGLSGVVAGGLLQGLHLSWADVTVYPALWVVIVVAIAIGTLVGWCNGVLVTRFKVAPFVATLGMMYVARGAAMLLSDGKTFSQLAGQPELGNQGFRGIGLGEFPPKEWLGHGIPTGIWVMVAVGLIAYVLLGRTPFGRWLYAVGGNARAAELSGVPVKKVETRVYVLCGFASAVVGLIIASELSAAAPQTGESYELNAIAAVVIGGAALSGGRGTVRGTLIGAFVIGFLSDGLVIVGVSEFWQRVIKGLVIIAAVALDQLQQGLKRRPAAPADPGKRPSAPEA